MIRELASIVITRNIPEHGLRRGDIGAVVHCPEKLRVTSGSCLSSAVLFMCLRVSQENMSNCYKDGAAFEVEFVTGKGGTVAVITRECKDVRPMYPNEILHARETKAA